MMRVLVVVREAESWCVEGAEGLERVGQSDCQAQSAAEGAE